MPFVQRGSPVKTSVPFFCVFIINIVCLHEQSSNITLYLRDLVSDIQIYSGGNRNTFLFDLIDPFCWSRQEFSIDSSTQAE